MPRYKAFYLKDDLSHRFRELPATSVRKQLKPRDYPVTVEIEAANEYSAWRALQAFDAGQPGEQAGRAFTVGDAVETEDGKLLLCQFGGFEEAAWWAPEAQPEGCATAAEREPKPIPEPHPGPEPQPAAQTAARALPRPTARVALDFRGITLEHRDQAGW